MIILNALLILALQAFLPVTLVRAAIVASSLNRCAGVATNDFTAPDIVKRLLPDPEVDDNGKSVSHTVLQAIVVVLVLFLVFLFALFLFRKHRIRRLRERWQTRPNLRVAPVRYDSSTPLMSEIPMLPPSPAVLKTPREMGEGRWRVTDDHALR